MIQWRHHCPVNDLDGRFNWTRPGEEPLSENTRVFTEGLVSTWLQGKIELVQRGIQICADLEEVRQRGEGHARQYS